MTDYPQFDHAYILAYCSGLNKQLYSTSHPTGTKRTEENMGTLLSRSPLCDKLDVAPAGK